MATETHARDGWNAAGGYRLRSLPGRRRCGSGPSAFRQCRRGPIDARSRRSLWALLAIGAGLTTGATAGASEPTDSDIARELVEAGRILPLEDLLVRARRLRPGVLVAVELEYEAEHRAYIYEIELLDPAGRVWEVEIDAASGELIELEPED